MFSSVGTWDCSTWAPVSGASAVQITSGVLLGTGRVVWWASPVAWLGDLVGASEVAPDLAVRVEVAVEDPDFRNSSTSDSGGETGLLRDGRRAGVLARRPEGVTREHGGGAGVSRDRGVRAGELAGVFDFPGGR